MLDFSVRLPQFTLKNPVMTASGTSGHRNELEQFFLLQELGAFVTKGLSSAPKIGNPPPRICETPMGMLNAIGLENPGIDTFLTEYLDNIPHNEVPVIANCFGNDEESYVTAVEHLGADPRIAALELNISCPNVKMGGLAFGSSPQSVHNLVTACAAATKKPLFVKLSPIHSNTLEHAHAAINAGAAGLTCFNTHVGTDIDIKTRRFALSPGKGGLSGPAILPINLLKVYEICRAFPETPVFASGGIASGADAFKYILAGAWAVQTGTAILTQPVAPIRIINELRELLLDQGIKSLAEIRGAVLPA